MFIYDKTPDSLDAASSLIATRACRHGDRAASAPSIQPVVSSLTSPASGWRYFTSMATPLFGLTRHPFRTWLFFTPVCAVTLVDVVVRERGDESTPRWSSWRRALMLLRPSRRTILTGAAKDGSGARLCALRGLLRGIICLDKRWETPRPNARSLPAFSSLSGGVCNKVTAVTYIWTGIM